MPTVFSHIIQKQFSRQNENVATEALAYVLDPSKPALRGLAKMLRGLEPQLPQLWFRTQQSENSSRPDMWGYDESLTPKVFVENKFWAGLTNNQPVAYLRTLAQYPSPTILLVVAPDRRMDTLWRELRTKMAAENLTATDRETSAGIVRSATTNLGPIIALTSWGKLLTCLEAEALDDKPALSDLAQLRSLCESADSDAFVPITAEQACDQRTPAFILQLSSIVQSAAETAASRGVLDLKDTRPQASTERIGRYAFIGNDRRAGLWMGINLVWWKQHGGTPLWALFQDGQWGRGREARALLEPWAAKRGIFATGCADGFAVALDIIYGGDKDQVVSAIADRLEEIANVLSALKGKAAGDVVST